ncbi:MAG TPA: hypothetical protein VG253_14520 [Streptosporangiaceae bacterium]|nr:hypothetical protein [Streptosporangiaceae bacterium]
MTRRRATSTLVVMARDILQPLAEILEEQCGVLARQQALRAGLTDKTIEAALRSARWKRLHLGVYVTFTGEPGRSSMMWAALLRAGPAAILSHQTAAELQDLLTTAAPGIHVTVPRGAQVRPIRGVVLHYSSRVRVARHPVLMPPRTRIEDTVLDVANDAADLDTALGWIFRACASRRTTPARIEAALASRSRIRWRAELTGAIRLGGQGVHSILEFRYVSHVERPHGLPSGKRQRQVRRGVQRQYRDVEYRAFGLVVELDGQAAHPAERRWSDARRDNATAAAGEVTLRYGWSDVTERPCLVAAEIGATLRHRGWTGKLRGCGPACPVKR